MHKKFLFIFSIQLITLVHTKNYAQTKTKSLVIHSFLGFNAPQLNTFNTVLANEGLPQFKEFYFTRGGGFYTTFPNVKLATLFNFSTFSGTKNTGNQSTWLRSSQVGTSLGFLLKNTDKFQVIPYGGLVYSFFGARVTSNNVNSIPFNSYFSGSPNQYHVAVNQFMGNVGLHISKIGIGNNGISKKTVIGFRTGYFIPAGKGKWTSNENELTNGPSVNTGGFYAALILGLQQ